jgi:hypothetical protein
MMSSGYSALTGTFPEYEAQVFHRQVIYRDSIRARLRRIVAVFPHCRIVDTTHAAMRRIEILPAAVERTTKVFETNFRNVDAEPGRFPDI